MFSPHHITKTTALALALGAVAAPAAAADRAAQALLVKAPVVKTVSVAANPSKLAPFAYSRQEKEQITTADARSSGNGSGSTGEQGAPPILPAPTASQSAAIQRAEQQAAHEPILPTGARYSNAEMSAYPSGSAAVRAIASDGGFDWGDAGIGAAGGLAIAMLGVGGGLALSQRRSRRAGTSAVVAG